MFVKRGLLILITSGINLTILLSGCSEIGKIFDSSINDEPTLQELMINPKNVTLKFRYNNSYWTFNYTVYKGLNDYLSGLPRSMKQYPGTEVTTKDFIMREISQEYQNQLIQSIINLIKNFTNNTDDQAKIIISIVQNIPYDYNGFKYGSLTSKYPYEVLYTQLGVCGEKSNLMVLLLRELGFKVAVFEFKENNHRAVGVYCDPEYDYRDTGYCFIETTTPHIITDSEGNYSGNILFDHALITISDGISFQDLSEEFEDAKEFNRLNNLSQQNDGKLDYDDYEKWLQIKTKYGLL